MRKEMFPLTFLPLVIVLGGSAAWGCFISSYKKGKVFFASLRLKACTVTDEMLGELARTGSGRLECLICLDEFAALDVVTSLSCTHVFHKKCFGEFLRSGGQTSLCPTCREPVAPKSSCLTWKVPVVRFAGSD